MDVRNLGGGGFQGEKKVRVGLGWRDQRRWVRSSSVQSSHRSLGLGTDTARLKRLWRCMVFLSSALDDRNLTRLPHLFYTSTTTTSSNHNPHLTPLLSTIYSRVGSLGISVAASNAVGQVAIRKPEDQSKLPRVHHLQRWPSAHERTLSLHPQLLGI
jgi:hypothetical protein